MYQSSFKLSFPSLEWISSPHNTRYGIEVQGKGRSLKLNTFSECPLNNFLDFSEDYLQSVGFKGTDTDRSIWSLMLLFSEAAVWVVSGLSGIVQQYRNQLRTEMKDAAFLYDGPRLLQAFKEMQRDIFESVRHYDFVTKAVLSVIENTISASKEQPTASMLSPIFEKIIQDAKLQMFTDQPEVDHLMTRQAIAPTASKAPELPTLSLAEAIDWKESRKMGKLKPLEGQWLIERLRERSHVSHNL